MPLEDVEVLERRRPIGYHPVAIGDPHGRCPITHKSGFGGLTIWLAKDDQVGKYAAIKILIADGDSQECKILRQLGPVNLEDRPRGKATIPQ